MDKSVETCGVLTIFLRYVFLSASRPVTEGRLISVSRRGAGSGGRDMTLHRRCDAGPRRSKPRLSQRARPARRGPVMAGRPCSRHRSAASSALAWLRWDVMRRFRPHMAGTTTGEDAEQTSNTARGTPRVWRTCGTLCRSFEPERKVRHTGLRQASMSRGVEAPRVQLDPWRSARPRFFFRAMRTFSDAGGSRRLIKNPGGGAMSAVAFGEGGLFDM